MKLVRRFINRVSKYFEHSDFIKPFIATLLGVLIAFALTDYRHTLISNKVTAERIHILYLETQYNGVLLKEALKYYSKPVINEIFFRRTSYLSAMSAVNDPNIVSFLPKHKLSLLLNYIESIRSLNLSLDIHQEFAISTNTKSFEYNNNMIEAIRSNIAEALASCYLNQRELSEYFDAESYDHKILDSLKVEQEKLKMLYLQNLGINN